MLEYAENLDNRVLESKLDEVFSRINSLNTENVKDDEIVKFLTLSKLKDEIMRSE